VPHDPIERGEWEGGAVAAEPAAHALSEAPAVELDDLEPSPGTSATTTSPTRGPSGGTDRRLVETPPASGSVSPEPTTR
jgi:hypothetical protein